MGQHIKSQPSMPQFLKRITNDNQLKNIIANVFSKTSKHNQHLQTRTVSAMNINSIQSKHSVPIPTFTSSTAHTNKKKKKTNKKTKVKKKKEDVQELHNKIEELEQALVSHRETTSNLQETIAKIQAQKDEANKEINETSDSEQIVLLKNKNAE